MNIAFDAAAILGPMSKNRGIGNYAYSQFKTMIEMDQKNTYYFFNVFEEFSMKDAVGKENIVDTWFFTGKNHELISDEEYKEFFGDIIKKFLRENQIDIFYITSPFDLSLTNYQKEWFDGVKTITTVYDIIPYVMKKKYLSDKITYNRYMECVHMLRWVDEYLVISQSVKNDMISYLKFPKEKIHVIYGAADPKIYRQICMTRQETGVLFDKFHIQGRYIMCTGGDDDRKNIEGLIRAYSKIQKDLLESYQLIIVCRLSRQAVEKYSFMIQELQLEGRVILTNFVSVQDLVRLYNQADLMAFPSLYEGFGLPILEAWMCGTPVLTSDNSSLGEIGKDAAVLVKAECISSITEGLNYALTEADLEKLRRNAERKLAMFNWETTVRSALSVLNSFRVLETPASESSEIKKIAMFTPLPPIQSGISDYSADIISELQTEFEIDVYIDKYRADFEERERVHIYPAKAFAKKQKVYDRIIYQVGNSLYHAYMFPYIKKYPGIVVLHDCNLKNVLEAMYLYQSDQPQKFIQNMLEDYDQAAVDQYMQQLNTAYTLNFEINGFVVNYAEKIIVHSQYAKKRLLSGNIGRQVQVIPLYAVIEHDNTIKQGGKKSSDGKEYFVFAAFGHIHETKRVIPALTAFGRLCKQQPDKKLMFYFVGKMAKELEGRFREKVCEYDLEERVYVTGYVSMEKFSEYLDMADVCVNLRYPYHGESSGSFMRALAKGKCVIVNRIGSFSEIPEDACIMIRNAAEMSTGEEIEEIYQAMRLSMNESFREDIQDGAKRYAQDYLDLKKVGKQYIQVIKEKRKRKGLNEEKLKKFAEKYVRNYTVDEIKNMAKTMAYTISSCEMQGGGYRLRSQICKQEQLESPEFRRVYNELKINQWFDDFAQANHISIPKGILHRKSWEYIYIVLALRERGMLRNGKYGLGFAVGSEPLPAYFASQGCRILATDLDFKEPESKKWINHGQNVSGDLTVLNKHQLCKEEIFKEKVTYKNVDMNHIPEELQGFDFCWSSCAIEHVGSLEKSKLFLKNMLHVLKPGGIAVHTTEYNLSSDVDTIAEGESVLYRKSDILELVRWLRNEGHKIDIDLSVGQSEGDLFTDQPPYYQLNPRYHLRLNIGGYDSTSIGLIIRKTE